MLAQKERRMSYAEIYKYRQQTPAMPARITQLLNVARENLLFIPRLTADNKPCDPLLDKYLQLKKELAAAIDASDNGTPCQQLDMAEYMFGNGSAETLVEGWVRAWITLEGERLAAEMLQAAHAQQEQFRLADRVEDALTYGAMAEMLAKDELDDDEQMGPYQDAYDNYVAR